MALVDEELFGFYLDVLVSTKFVISWRNVGAQKDRGVWLPFTFEYLDNDKVFATIDSDLHKLTRFSTVGKWIGFQAENLSNGEVSVYVTHTSSLAMQEV